MTSFAFSCIADKPPALLAQTFVWVNCLKGLRSINPRDIFVHVVEVEDRDFLDWLKAEQVNIISAERFDPRSPHCNKLQQLRTFEGSAYDQIVLMDCDTAWVGNAPLPSGAPVAACLVDHANPPERVLLNIFNLSGLGAPKWMPVSVGRSGAPEYTDVNNCNGGLYICDAAFLAKLDRAWRFWANWCLDRSALFESAAVHVDQVSFALAMRELRANVAHLPLAWNYPMHLTSSLLPDVSPEILHYHGELNGDLSLNALGIPQVDRTVEQLNAGIAEFVRPNPLPALRQKFAESRTAKSAGNKNIATQAASVSVAAPAVKHAPGRSRFGKVVVGSGWWCDETPHEWAIGSPTTRSVEFFELWYRQVARCLEPDRIVVTDSASPIKPNDRSGPLLHWIELDRNYGQANDIRTGRIATKYSGFTRSVINGAMHALCCDADVYVYVEQDCLLRGEDFLGYAIGDSTTDILLGAPTENGKGLGGAVAATMLQQSLIIVRRAGLERFLIGLLGAPWTDGELSPEEIMRRRLAPFDFVQLPYGRSRPIDFTRPHFYAQHLNDDELRHFLGDLPSAPLAEYPQPGSNAAEAQSDPRQFCPELLRELDLWLKNGVTARLWWRDDDAASDTPELQRLLRLARDFGIVVALAVIPEQANQSLVKVLSEGSCCIWQHGYRHRWQDEEYGRNYAQGEFGEGRPLEQMVEDARQGFSTLNQLFGPAGWQPVFVPPFHALSIAFKMMVPSLGYHGISAGTPLTPKVDGVPEINAEIDIMNWPERRFLGADLASAALVEQLRLRRTREIPLDMPIGLLTHHPALDDDAWRFLEMLLDLLRSHDAVEFVPADKLFQGSAVKRSRSSNDRAQKGADQVTVVMTSCGRQDLLETTLDSFLENNTYPIHQFVIIEDGEASANRHLQEKYRRMPFTWLATGERVGQIAAIDIAYAEISTEYIFHCEDDWQFTSSGFVEKSMSILKHDDQILQVWLRALNDTNRQPLFDHVFEVEGIPYKVLRHHHDAGEWGIWHGFSWNPGLRRRREYDLIGSFTSLDPDGTRHTWQVESSASEFYQKRGFFAAILADNNGRGYVRHLGGGRRVPRVTVAAARKAAGFAIDE